MQRLDFSDARHLVARSALGQEWDIVDHLKGRSRADAVNILLSRKENKTPALPAMTPWNNIMKMSTHSHKGKRDARMQMGRESVRLKQWWMHHLLTTKAPVQERMTIFWHNHFTSSFEKVQQPKIMYMQNQLLRENALGNFAVMLRKISRDPAMLVYLDGSLNKKGKPNENFARELLELFTLGRGHYSEADVKAAAIAFTGWGADRHQGKFVYNPAENEGKRVKFLNQWVQTGDQVIDVLLKQHRTAEHIAEKFWHEFVSYHRPPAGVIRRWGNVFRASNYQITTLFKEVLNSNEFWDARYRGNLIKSPVDLVIGTLRALPYPRPAVDELVRTSQLLGQDLLDPPSVKGWTGGKQWIDTQTLLVRTSLLNRLTRHTKASAHVEKKLPNTKDGEEVVNWLLPRKPSLSLPTTPGKLRLVKALVLDPTYQLK
ncbi:DUF1800 domain-containing protein [Leucothrix pacifica]|uniref:DUF1800 domain-containing protein n=1 Tax=Leucothrix pacifica TaxID=1247513 RepID=A0A317CPI4_9GAMM|nr:DUF1800 domain-containing protein [Leucothrix pacifica]PWR00138.1 DUF1800 domain-containing protein [Leucothrix pacifica]